MQRVLITGANGLLASVLLERLKNSYDIYATYHQDNIPFVQGVNYIKCDFSQDWSIQKLPSRIDIVIHAAQSSKYKEFPSEALDVFSVNTASTAKLLDYSRKAEASKFIYFSTGGLYQQSTEIINEASPLHPINCLNYHFASKLSGELLVNTYSNLFETTIIRPFFMYGRNQRRSMLIPRLVDNIKNAKTIYLEGEIGLRINPIHVDDAAFFIQSLLDSKKDGLFNLGGPDILSIKEICLIIAQKLNKPVFFETTKNPPLDLITSTNRMDMLLNRPKIKFAHGVDDVLYF